MRIATWNIEWFTGLFDHEGRILEDDAASGRYGVSRRAQLLGIGIVMAAMDADAIFIVEAPDDNKRQSTVAQLEAFAALCGLRCRAAIMGLPSDTEQELALLYDPDVLTPSFAPGGTPEAPRFDAVFGIDLGGTAGMERAHFARAPLELLITPAKGAPFRMIGVHAKSKAPHGARNDADVARIGARNRRKQIAQCLWLRRRIETHLREGARLIVLGDLNDGPGLDDFEGLLGISGVEIVMGCDLAQGCAIPGPMRLYDPHALAALRRPLGGGPSTARFFDQRLRRFFPALLDYILVSHAIELTQPGWRIWHPFDDPKCFKNDELRQALLDASDHFPVTLDFDP